MFLSILVRRSIRRCIGLQSPTLRNLVSKMLWTKINNFPGQSRYMHIVSRMEDIQRYRRLKLGIGNHLETGFQTLFFSWIIRKWRRYLRHFEVYGSRTVLDGRDVNFNNLPDELRELELDDLERLKAAIETAGLQKGMSHSWYYTCCSNHMGETFTWVCVSFPSHPSEGLTNRIDGTPLTYATWPLNRPLQHCWSLRLSSPTEPGVKTPSAEVRVFDFSLVEQWGRLAASTKVGKLQRYQFYTLKFGRVWDMPHHRFF